MRLDKNKKGCDLKEVKKNENMRVSYDHAPEMVHYLSIVWSILSGAFSL